MDSLVEGPMLWFLNRSTGLVILGLLTMSTVLGITSTWGRGGGNTPRRFASQALHRNISLLSVVMLTLHVITAVIDTYVDIRWWQVFSPFGATYEPFWMALGALSFDLIALIVVTSLIRARLRHRSWRLIHLSAYAAWALGLVHGLGIGTDMTGLTSWGVGFSLGCLAVVVAAGTARLWSLRTHRAPMESSLT